MKDRVERFGEGVVLYLADCREILPDIAVTDICVPTDPPYGTGRYETDTSEAVLPVARRFIGKAPLAMFGYPEHLCEMVIALGVPPIEWITWWPTNTNGTSRSEKLPRESEHIAIWADEIDTEHIKRERSHHTFARKMAIQRGRDPNFVRDGDVWRDPSPNVRDHAHRRQHINEKPVSVMEKLIGCWDCKTVLDPFMGSGTTGVAAIRLGRRFIGIDKVEEHFDTACRRVEDALSRPGLFVASL